MRGDLIAPFVHGELAALPAWIKIFDFKVDLVTTGIDYRVMYVHPWFELVNGSLRKNVQRTFLFSFLIELQIFYELKTSDLAANFLSLQ